MVELDVAEVVLHRALRHVLDTIGEPLAPYRVSDRPGRPCDVLVARLTPLSCREALRAVQAGMARAVLRADRPDDLPALLRRLAMPWCAIPRLVLELAEQAEVLTNRQRAAVQAIGEGRRLHDAAQALGVSEATLKRDLRRLRLELGLPDRAAIVARARELGL